MGDAEGSEGVGSDMKVNKLSYHTPFPVAPSWLWPISSHLHRLHQSFWPQ